MWSFARQRAATIAGATSGVFAHIVAQAQQGANAMPLPDAGKLLRVFVNKFARASFLF